MVRALFCRELLGLSGKGFYEYLSLHERAERLGFGATNFGKYNTAPTRQTLTIAWDEVLTNTTKRAILSLSERLVEYAHENEEALDCRPPRHVDAQNESDLRKRETGAFSTDQIRQTVRLARDTVFGAFDSGRADNAVYPDRRFAELQAFMSLKNCGTPQGSRRMAQFRGEGATPHGDTHLRTVAKFDHERILDGFTQSVVNLLKRVNHIQILQSPVTVAIDITTWQFHADSEFPPEVSGTKHEGVWAYKFATLSLVGKSMPVILAYEPVVESSPWDDNRPHKYHRTVKTLLNRAQQFVNVDLVLADRGFESHKVYQTLDNLGVDYLLPKIARTPEFEVTEKMEEAGVDTRVNCGHLDTPLGSHECRVLYVPGRDEGTHAFITNRSVGPEHAAAWVEHYANRWCIENEYRAIKQEFLATTSSTNHALRTFYFVFGILMYNVWRLTDVLLKATVTRELTTYTPVLTAGELADWVALHLHAEPD
jgi:hypothetical protein